MFWDALQSFVGVVADMSAASATSKAANFNKNMSRFNAVESLRQGKVEEDRVRRNARKQIGLLRANVGASGFDLSGSALDVLYESTMNMEIDATNTRDAYNAQAKSYQMQGDLYGMEAKDATKAGYLSAAKTLIRGATNVYGDNADQSSGDEFKLGRIYM